MSPLSAAIARKLEFDSGRTARMFGDKIDPELAVVIARSERARTASIDQLWLEVVEALELVSAQHQLHKDAQAKHYSQRWYDHIQHDGLKYDVAVWNTIMTAEMCRIILAKLSKAVGEK